MRTGGASCSWFDTIARNKKNASYALTVNTPRGVIGEYIVDFFFRKSMLIVELDGGYHFTEEQQKEDAIRQSWLENMGYKVLRFTNEEVLFNTESVISKIKFNLK